MGGSAGGGNTTELAEFNAWVDPHAVEVTLEAGLTLSMYGLDLTKQVRLDGGDVAQLRDAGTPTSKRAAEFLDFYRGTSTANVDGKAMHDPCAVLGTTHPDLFARAPSRIVVGTAADEKRGQTTVLEPVKTHRHAHITTAEAPSVTSLIREAAIDPGGSNE